MHQTVDKLQYHQWLLLNRSDINNSAVNISASWVDFDRDGDFDLLLAVSCGFGP